LIFLYSYLLLLPPVLPLGGKYGGQAVRKSSKTPIWFCSSNQLQRSGKIDRQTVKTAGESVGRKGHEER
jgi:hypothetical protein